MEYREFVQQVQSRAGITTFEQAEYAVITSLEMLGKRMGRNAAAHIAQQLPPELASYIISTEEPDLDIHDLNELIARVGKKERAGYEAVESHVRAVIPVLVDAVTPAAIQRAIAGLPREMRIPFEKELAAEARIPL